MRRGLHPWLRRTDAGIERNDETGVSSSAPRRGDWSNHLRDDNTRPGGASCPGWRGGPVGREHGSVTVFVAGVALALVGVAGLVADGGAVLAASERAFNEAEAAARAGAQAVSPAALHGGPLSFDSTDAASTARAYLVSTGHDGTVSVANDTVEVTVTFDEPLPILALIGPRHARITGRASARAARSSHEAQP